tara:strand:+ start:1171 stop:1686 length:516 start_codon:yes stop_codon:yes gene_type:complete
MNKILKIVDDDLKQFKDWYKKNNTINIPHDKPLMFIDGIMGITLYRKGQYQVQLFICEPNNIITEHSHPNIDSYEMYLWGMEFSHLGKPIINKEMSLMERRNKPGEPRWKGFTLRILPGERHDAKSSIHGGAFLSIQKWLNNIKPSHVSEDWDGNILGDKHKDQLRKYKYE